MKFFFRTLGCKMNFLDSARISAALQTGGHELAELEENADTIFVNSCTVTSRADRQSRQEAYKAQRLGKTVVLFGCGPRIETESWKELFENVLVFQNENELISHFKISPDELEFPLTEERTRMPVAIQTGCDNHCTFCITRIARGKTEDFPEEKILDQINRAYFAGVQEIVLTGIQLASYGCGDSEKYPEQTKLPQLLKKILKKTKIPRIRMSSLGPQFLMNRVANCSVHQNNEFFEIFSNPRICDHLHLSVQSGSPAVLEKMNRGHGVEEIFSIVEKARKARPDTAFTADFIAGFPGETEKNFQETLDMVREIGFAKLHVFPFSPRKGTGAANFPDQIEAKIKKERAKKLRKLGTDLRKKFCFSHLGKSAKVLVEEKNKGFTKNYVRVKVPEGKMGKIYEVKITEENIVDDFEK